MSFDDVVTWTQVAPGQYRSLIDDSWTQGRTLFGGVMSASALRGMRDVVPSEREIRTLDSRFLRPLGSGEVHMDVSVLREGRSLTQVEARLSDARGVSCVAVGSFGSDRVSTVTVPGAPRPERPPPEALPAMPEAPGVPQFTRHFDYRWSDGAPPFSGSHHKRLGGWCRFRRPTRLGPETVTGLLDAWPAPTLAMLTRPAPASTVSWTAFFHQVPEEAPPGWWWFTSETVWARDGYAQTQGQLFDPSGALAATMVQSVVVFG